MFGAGGSDAVLVANAIENIAGTSGYAVSDDFNNVALLLRREAGQRV